jgi:glycosyltransferase involved in cell wall biosynthesis
MSVNVLLLTGIFPPDLGGPATFNSKFAYWAVQQDFQIRVLTYSHSKKSEPDDIKFRITRINRNQNIAIRYLKMILCIILHGLQSDVILANGCFIELSISKLFLTRPVITKIPGDPLWERARNNGETKLGLREFQAKEKTCSQKFLRFLTSRSVITSDFVITPSKELAALVTYWGVKTERIRIIPNAVDTNIFVPPISRKIDFDVVTMARLVPWKGIAELIEVCAELNQSLAVIGDGPELLKLQNLADRNNASVRFFGSLSQTESISVMNASSVFVLNSDYEGFPHALIEAMALELPCIARAGTGCDEIIQDGVNGFLVIPSLQTTSLRHVMDRDFSKKPMREIGKLARKDVIENYSHKKTFNTIGNLLRAAVSKN